jgi:hypothetical protein
MDKKDMILVEAGKMSFEKVDHILKNIISTQAYLNQNANAKLAMTALGMTVEMSAH